MKKSLSLLVAIAMVFSMFATVVSAAPAPGQSAGEYLKSLGVIQGGDKGDLMEDEALKRQDAAILVARLVLGLEEAEELVKNGEKTHTYTDVRGTYYDGVLSWAETNKYMEGDVAGQKFGFDREVTIQEFATVIVRALGFTVGTTEDVDVQYADVVAKAVELGLLAEGTDGKAAAIRGDLYDVIVKGLDTEVKGTGQTLGQLLDLPGYEVTVLAIAKVEQTDAREITVFFNKALTDDQKKDLTFEVKTGTIAYSVTAKYAEDNKSVALTASFLPAGEYTVTVKGFDAKTVTVVAEVASKIEISAPTLQRAENQDPKVKLLNQFDKEIANPTGLSVTVFNASKGQQVTAIGGKYDLTGGIDTATNQPKFSVDDSVVVTATHSSGLSTSKTYKLIAGSAATSIKIGTVQPLEGKTRISAGDAGLVLPIELLDQYGNKIDLAEKTKTTVGANDSFFVESGITFTLSTVGVVSSYAIDSKGVLTFDVANPGTLVIHAFNPATGATGSTTVKVEGAPIVKTLTLGATSTVVAGEEVVINFQAVDNFGDLLKAKDIKINTGSTFQQNQLQFNSSLPMAAGYPKFNAKGELLFKFDVTLTSVTKASVLAFINGSQAGQITLDVHPAAKAVKVNGLKDVLTTIVNGVDVDFNKDKVTYLDDLGRTKTVGKVVYNAVAGAGEVQLTLVSGDSATVVTDASNNAIKIAADATKTGITKFKAEIVGTANSSFEFTVNVVKASDVKTYSIKSLGTIYGGKDASNNALTATSAHAKEVVLVGKIGGTEVAINQATAFDFVSVEGAAASSGLNGSSKYAVYGLAEGTATVIASKNGSKIAETTVTISTAAPVASKVEFNTGEYTLNSTTNSLTFSVNDANPSVTVKDQYDVKINVLGNLTSSDTNVATVVKNTDGTYTVARGTETGTTTLTYITANNVTATAVLLNE